MENETRQFCFCIFVMIQKKIIDIILTEVYREKQEKWIIITKKKDIKKAKPFFQELE
jgi:hypothetical protein